MKYNIYKNVTIFILALSILSCGQQESKTAEATLVDRVFAPVNVDYGDSNNDNKRVYNALIDVAELLLMRQAYVSNIEQTEGLASYRNERTIRRSIVSGARDGKAAEGAMKLTPKKIENIVISGKNALAPYKGLQGVNGSIEIVYIDRRHIERCLRCGNEP